MGPGGLDRLGRRTRPWPRSSGPSQLGCNFFDTAWGYGDGRSEQMLGRLVRNHPDKELYVATKVPPKNRKWPSRRGFTLDDCFPPDYIREYAEKSLRNLELTRIDLLQFHVWEDAWAHDERWQRAIEDLKRPGADPRRRDQRQPLGARQRARDAADRA